MNNFTALVAGVLIAGIGGEFFLRGLTGIARWLRVSPALVATTIAAFATSSPELSVAISSALAGEPEVSLGDALGSNVVNIAFILGIAFMIAPTPADQGGFIHSFIGALLVPMVIGLLALDGELSRRDGGILLALFAIWMGMVLREALVEREHAGAGGGQPPGWKTCAASLGGLGCLFAGGHFIVIGATGVARKFGVPEFVIGATIVAVGTSVPELATTITAQIKGPREVGLGTALGSNVFNGLFIVGVAAVIHPIATNSQAVAVALVVGLVTTVMTLPPRNGFFGRRRGLLLLTMYAAYVAVLLRG